jgi:hypothetical protein
LDILTVPETVKKIIKDNEYNGFCENYSNKKILILLEGKGSSWRKNKKN